MDRHVQFALCVSACLSRCERIHAQYELAGVSKALLALRRRNNDDSNGGFK